MRLVHVTRRPGLWIWVAITAVITLLTVGLTAGLNAGTAQAEPPQSLDGIVTDPAGFLDQKATDSARESLSAVRDNGTNASLVVIKDFGGADPYGWCTDAAQQSNLGGADVVYVIAYEQRQYSVCFGSALNANAKRINQAAKQAATKLRSTPLTGSDVADATGVFADKIEGITPGEASGSGNSGGDDSEDSIWGVAATIAIVALFGGAVAWFISRPNKNLKGTATTGARGALGRQVDPQKAAQDASRALMEADNSMQAAADDLAFARAQFGQLDTQKFAQAVDQANALLDRGFKLQRELDQGGTDPSAGSQVDRSSAGTHGSAQRSAQERLQLAEQIQSLAQRAQTALEKHVEEFQRLRDVETNAEDTLKQLRTSVTEAAAKTKQADAELAGLQRTYPQQALLSISDNPTQARNLLEAANQALDDAQEQLESDRSAAVQQINIAQRALTQALKEIHEVMGASQDLDKAQERLTQAIASISSDIADTHRLAPNDTAFEPLVAAAQEAVKLGQEAQAGNADPLAALANLRRAEDTLDAALASLRGEEQQRERAAQRLEDRKLHVDQLIDRADRYTRTHRANASLSARSALKRAQELRGQAQAMEQEDPERALHLLGQAQESAQASINETLDARQQDNLSTSNSGGIDLGTLMLGGLLFGGGHSTGWGGSNNSWGSDSSSWGSGGSFGGFSGGFGGFSGGGGSSGSF
ncbi:TPM domain-containing protein [Gleimia hominis]|uniref:TPM domain-containing protein n=1 Tax=Gleimia hominis TaxID=595468 RepID=UPI000C801AEB|nr:TPM domain-containing protein [Gleimia hominis]WIK63808.1 hypothetical protein CJ187_005670 [Gleimia hominis]